jgi:hypothetical protein
MPDETKPKRADLSEILAAHKMEMTPRRPKPRSARVEVRSNTRPAGPTGNTRPGSSRATPAAPRARAGATPLPPRMLARAELDTATRDAERDAERDALRDEARDFDRDCRRDALRDLERDAQRDEDRDSERDAHRDTHRDAERDAKRDA